MITVKCTDRAQSAVVQTYLAMIEVAKDKGNAEEAQMTWDEIVEKLRELGTPVHKSTVRNHTRLLLAREWIEKHFALSDTGAREPNIYRFLYDTEESKAALPQQQAAETKAPQA